MSISSLPIIKANDARKKINVLASQGRSFFFAIDFNMENAIVLTENEQDTEFIRFNINGFTNEKKSSKKKEIGKIQWDIFPISFEQYRHKFNSVIKEIQLGNSFLINLTQPTKINHNTSLLSIYKYASAKYKVWLKDTFLVLSPEPFIRTQGKKISSFPMKGTIDASIPNAEKIILNNPKEMAEHATIVDLIRNDLSIVASNIYVKKYRYIEKITTLQKDLLQVSSEISGTLPDEYNKHMGDILFKLLPAGSISGAPKHKTLDIIATTEGYERGFYTGVCGYFDGENMESAVMIRFVEEKNKTFIFKSGGGITAQSDVKKEYEELINKVYVPVF